MSRKISEVRQKEKKKEVEKKVIKPISKRLAEIFDRNDEDKQLLKEAEKRMMLVKLFVNSRMSTGKGAYYPKENKIEISSEDLESGNYHALIHEYLHCASHTVSDAGGFKIKSDSYLKRLFNRYSLKTAKSKYVNEAFTELFAKDISNEKPEMIAYGNASDEIKQIFNNENRNKLLKAYIRGERDTYKKVLDKNKIDKEDFEKSISSISTNNFYAYGRVKTAKEILKKHKYSSSEESLSN